MSVPPDPIPRRPPELRRNLTLDLTAGIGIGITAALVGSLLPNVARREGLDPLGLAVLAAAPFLANLLGVLAGRIGPRTPRQLAATRVVGASSLLVLLVVPVPPAMALVALAFWLSIAFGVPFQMRLWGAMYPRELWGRIIGTIGTGRAAAAGIAALVGGLLADRFGGIPVVALAGLIGVACALAAAGFRAAAAIDPPPYSVRDSLRSLTSRPVLARVAAAQAFCGGGLIAATPLYVLVQVDRLSLSLGEVGQIALIGAAANTVSYLAWGAVMDRWGSHLPLSVGSALGAASLVVYAVAPGAPVLWVAAIFAGLCNSAIELGIQRTISDHTALDERASAMSGWNALTGARGVAAPFVASGLLAFGLVDVTGGLLLCAAASGVGMVLFFRLAAATRRGELAGEGVPGTRVAEPAAA